MIPKISRLNKIISIASVYSLNRRHKCFENRFNPREFAEPPCCRLCSSNGLTNDYQKLTIDSRSSKESRSLFLSPTFASCTAWTVFVLRSVPWRTSRNNATVSHRLRLADFLRIFIPRSRNCEVLQNSSNP